MAEYKAAIFFENDPDQYANVQRVCRNPCNIDIIKISETRHLRDIPWSAPPLQKLIADNNFSENPYLTFIQSQGITGDQYDQVSGIQQEHIEVLQSWITKTATQIPRVALFDWDRTITVFEGNYYPASRQLLSEMPGGVPEGFERDTLVYLCGGEGRVALIQQMFQICEDNGIDITILTNNSQCIDFFEDFEKLMKTFGDFTFKYICSVQFNSNKGLALQKTPGYDKFLVNPSMVGGKRFVNRSKSKGKRKPRSKANKKTTKCRK